MPGNDDLFDALVYTRQATKSHYSFKPTGPQLYAVNLINAMLGMNAHPTTKAEASDFIGKYYDQAKAIKYSRTVGQIMCPHQHTCIKAGTIADYCYEEYEDDTPCPHYQVKEEQPCTE